MIELLQREWRESMRTMIQSSQNEIFISSPFVTSEAVNFIQSALPEKFKKSGKINFLTNLSADNLVKGSNNPTAFNLIIESVKNFSLWHLPKLHAKVYISDKDKAIITFGNLTSGGLYNNFEYGIRINDKKNCGQIYEDILGYCQLGLQIDPSTLSNIIQIHERIKETQVANQKQQDKSFHIEINELLNSATEELIKDRLSVGATHQIFSKTILYVLKKHGSMSTEDIHAHVQDIHPDLCDDSVDRVIDGRHFGKKWKHAVRSSQQHLKKNGLISLEGKIWKLQI